MLMWVASSTRMAFIPGEQRKYSVAVLGLVVVKV